MALAGFGVPKHPFLHNTTAVHLGIHLPSLSTSCGKPISHPAFFLSKMASPPTARHDPVELLETEAEKLMDFVACFNTMTQKPARADITEAIERGAPVIWDMTDSASKLKAFAYRYNKINNVYELYMDLESMLWEALTYLKRERLTLTTHLRSHRHADEVEDAYFSCNADIIDEMLRKREEMFMATASLTRVIQAYQGCVANVIRRKYGCAREIWAIEADSKALLERMHGVQMAFIGTMSMLSSSR